jgi:hypothetical protein
MLVEPAADGGNASERTAFVMKLTVWTASNNITYTRLRTFQTRDCKRRKYETDKTGERQRWCPPSKKYCEMGNFQDGSYDSV